MVNDKQCIVVTNKFPNLYTNKKAIRGPSMKAFKNFFGGLSE